MSNFLNCELLELLIEEQRKILKLDANQKITCHSNMIFLKKEYNKCFKKNKKSAHIIINESVEKNKICIICLDKHPINEIIKTECSHYFGNICYAKYIISCLKNNKSNIFCPLCKKINPSTSTFIYNKKIE